MAAVELFKSKLFTDANLIGYWRLNNGVTTTDSSPSGFTLTEVGSPTFGAGLFDYAITTASGKYTYINNSAACDITTGAFSTGVWFKTNDAGVTTKNLLSKWSGTTGNWSVRMSDGGHAGLLQAEIYESGGYKPTAWTSATYNDNNWHLMVLTRPASGGNFIVNLDGGAETVTVANVGASLTNAGNFTIGERPATAGNFIGQLDDAFFFNRTLSPTEIAARYSGADAIASGGAFLFNMI